MEAAQIAVKIRDFSKEAIVLTLAVYFMFNGSKLYGERGQEAWGGQIVSSETGLQDPDPAIKSKYFVIYAGAEVDLNRVYKRLNRRSFSINYGRRPDSLASWEEKISYRMDSLMERVKQILDIYSQDAKVNVRIFKTRKDLNEVYYGIFGVRGGYKSFYIHKLRTIYISEQDMDDSIMAHELGHAVVDHYFKVVPPQKMREMLATYVDLHLED